MKLFAALVQLFSVISLLRTNKPKDYGAYQLTLVPYAMMSLINIVSGFFTPSYPAVYMVRSSVMEEAERRGAFFDGWVGELDEDREAPFRQKIEEGTAKSGSLKDGEAGEGCTKWWRDILYREIQKPLICFGKFWDVGKDVLRLTICFHHLRNKLPLIRLILNPRHIQYVKSSSPPVKDIARSSQEIFNEVFSPNKTKDDLEKYYYVLPIGNVKHRRSAKQWMLYIMDLVVIAGLAAPWVTIYYLTGFRSPKNRVAGIFFILWLTLGQFLPIIFEPLWSVINSKIWRVKMLQAIIWSLLGGILCSVFALGGFYFIGQLMYQELSQHNNNCSKCQTTIVLHDHELATNYKY
jgi:hypothetical protein